MMQQIKHLTKLQLQNLYGINVFRFTKDKKEKRKKTALLVAYIVILLMMIFYVSGLTYGYVLLGLADMIPAYLVMISSLLILFFTIFKAGSIIFQRNGYDMLVSLPVSQSAIVISRFIRMYVENIGFTLLIMIPSMAVYGIFLKPSISFYLIGIVVMLFVPFLPITIATLVGALITAIASRMKHKNIVSAGLSVLLVVGIMSGSTELSKMGENPSLEQLQNMSETILTLIGTIYSPALWLGNAMVTGKVLSGLLCMAGSVVLFVVVIAVISAHFYEICQGMYSTGAGQAFEMKNQKKASVLTALYKRELKRYFASSVYVTNTIVGPIMAVIFSVVLLSGGIEEIQQMLELPFDIAGIIPFLLASIFCMMPPAATSISLEGKEWWIVKTLPIRTKNLLDAKILFNLSLIAPFYVIAEIIMIFALKPAFLELVWLVVIPAVLILFSGVYCIFINLKMPVFQWENEVAIVKQSASAFFGGIGGMLINLVCIVPILLVPKVYANWVKLAVCIGVMCITVLLYRKNNQVNLQKL